MVIYFSIYLGITIYIYIYLISVQIVAGSLLFYRNTSGIP